MAVITTNKTCLRKAKNQLEKHQMGFDGEHIGEVVLRHLGYKGVKLTSHKAKFDIITSREAWEIKTVGRDALDKKMSVKAKQKLEKLAWAKKNKKHPKSMLVIVNDSAEVYIRDGLGKFRAGGMKKVKTYKDWRKEVGHGRTERLVEGRPSPFAWKDVTTIKEATNQFKNRFNITSFKATGYGTNLKSALQDANFIGKQLEDLMDKNPGLRQYFDNASKRLTKNLNKLQVIDGGFSNTVQGVTSEIRGMYDLLNRDLLTATGKQVSKINELLVGKSRWSVGSDAASLFRHELGHHIYYLSVNAQKWEGLIKSWKPRMYISNYAGRSVDEAFAEAFAAFTSPLYGKSGYIKMPDKIEDFLRKLL